MPVTTVGSYEAKTHLPRLLAEVEAGGEIVITKHGRPIARIVPVEPGVYEVSEVIAQMEAARQGRTLGDDLTIKELIEEGRRW